MRASEAGPAWVNYWSVRRPQMKAREAGLGLGDLGVILPVRPGRSYRGGEAADVASPAIPQSAYSAEMP